MTADPMAADGSDSSVAADAATVPPDVWARLRGVRLHTRLRPPGLGSGLHAGSARGTGQEFAQYRPYAPGDDLRQVDWKLYARTDRHFVRDATRDAPLAVWLLLDATGSMAQADVARPGTPPSPPERKFDRAVRLAACVAELALQQGDSAGVVALGGTGPVVPAVPASAGARHRDRLRIGLASLRCGGGFPSAESMAPLWPILVPESLLVVIGDGFDDALVGWCERWAAARRQVVFVQVLGADERDFPFHGSHRFRDQETGATLSVTADAARDGFLARFAAAQAALARRLAAAGIAHAVHVLDEPPDRPLRHLFGGLAGRPATGASTSAP